MDKDIGDLYEQFKSTDEPNQQIFVDTIRVAEQYRERLTSEPLFESSEERHAFADGIKAIFEIICEQVTRFENGKSTHQIYDRNRTRAIKCLVRLLTMLNKILDNQKSEEMAALTMRACYKIIENSANNNLTKNQDLLNIICSALGYGIQNYNQSLGFCLKFIQMLQKMDQLAPLLAELVEFIVVNHDQRLLVGEILREIDRIDVSELSRDTTAPRAVSTFIVALSDKCPKEFLPSLDYVFGYLEQDSYTMRNASLTILANLIIKVFHSEDADKALRDEILDALLAHIHDITGYSRSKALNVWCAICENGCIPLSYIVPVTSAAVGRLKDKSCFVRKSAVRFIVNILSKNPYAKRLPLLKFLESYEIEKIKLDELIEEEKTLLEKEEEVLESNSQATTQPVESSSSAATNEGGDVANISQQSTQTRAKNVVLSEESAVVTQQRKVDFLRDAIAFTRQIHLAIPLCNELLTSKNITDVQEAIDFFVHCYEYGIDEALLGFKRMILLIHIQEKSIKDAVSAAYQRVFFESSRYENKPNLNSLIVTSFVNFVLASSIGECLSLEILLGQFLESRHLTKDMISELWARFTKKKIGTSDEEAIGAIQLLGMLAAHQPDIINHNLNLCLQYGLPDSDLKEHSTRLVKETCIAIRKSVPKKIEDKRRALRLSQEDDMFVRLENIIVNSLTQLECDHWFAMSDEAIKIIFDLAEHPEKISESIYRRMSEKLLKDAVPCQDTHRYESPDLVFYSSNQRSSGGGSQNPAASQTTQNPLGPPSTKELVDPIVLARYIHCLGNIALDLGVFLEMHVLLELKSRGTANDTSRHNISAHNVSISNRRRSRRYNMNKSMEENLDDELGLGGAEGEDIELEFIGRICDEEIVCGDSLLARLSKVITAVVTNPAFKSYPSELKQAAPLALAKNMMVSAKFCNDHLRLLFTMIEKIKDKEDREVKINLLIAISDLCIRFPNQLDGWTGKVFECLQSEEVLIRRTALKILSRLVLCDILKAKDQISTMANLIVDDDEHIASSSRHFFLELSKKLRAIYNIIPDIISRLSDPKTGIDEEKFKIVMKFMLELIDKSRDIDGLVEKLCGRFMDTDSERQWSDLAYCLSLLKYSDNSMRKLYEKFDCYKDKLCIDPVKDCILFAVTNYAKNNKLSENMQDLVKDLEGKICPSDH